MSHTPFGYRIVDGKAVIDSEAAGKVKTLFQFYLSGDSLATAGKKADIKSYHAGIGRMLRNTCYLGNEYYPAIIDNETFTAAEEERTKRAEKLGRIRKPKEKAEVVFPTVFYISEATQQFEDPFQQAEYTYSLIEMEVQEDGSQ